MTDQELHTKTFILIRGRGEWGKIPVVADGAIFPGGCTVVAWRENKKPTTCFPTLRECYQSCVEGRSGKDSITAIVTPDWKEELSADPWHPESFKGTPLAPAEDADLPERKLVWLQMDWCGNAVGVIGPAETEETP